MNICPVCALTGHIVEISAIRIMPGGNLQPSFDWWCPNCRTTGHHPQLDKA